MKIRIRTKIKRQMKIKSKTPFAEY